jgi:hypothetical protein
MVQLGQFGRGRGSLLRARRSPAGDKQARPTPPPEFVGVGEKALFQSNSQIDCLNKFQTLLRIDNCKSFLCSANKLSQIEHTKNSMSLRISNSKISRTAFKIALRSRKSNSAFYRISPSGWNPPFPGWCHRFVCLFVCLGLRTRQPRNVLRATRQSQRVRLLRAPKMLSRSIKQRSTQLPHQY